MSHFTISCGSSCELLLCPFLSHCLLLSVNSVYSPCHCRCYKTCSLLHPSFTTALISALILTNSTPWLSPACGCSRCVRVCMCACGCMCVSTDVPFLVETLFFLQPSIVLQLMAYLMRELRVGETGWLEQLNAFFLKFYKPESSPTVVRLEALKHLSLLVGDYSLMYEVTAAS